MGHKVLLGVGFHAGGGTMSQVASQIQWVKAGWRVSSNGSGIMTRETPFGHAASAGPRTIAVADERANSREVMRAWLGQAGFRVVEAGDAAELMDRIAARPDVVVLDAMLPGPSSFELANRLKNDPATAAIPIIHIASGYTTGEWRAQGLEAGADAFLTHPVAPQELIATVRALLRVREAEDDVRVVAEQWEATFDAITDGVCIVDGQGFLQRCNDTADELLGQLNGSRGEIPFHELFPPVSEPAPTVASVLTDGVPRQYESRVLGRWYAIRLDPVPPREHVPDAVVAVISDVTERRLAEEERMRLLANAQRATKEAEISRMEAEAARAEAEKASRAKSDFLAVMSHELRTPLNAIDGYAELLELEVRGPITAEQRDDLRRIRRSQKHLLSLINDVLNFVRLDSGTVRYEVREFALTEAIKDVEVVTAPQLRARELEFVRRNCGDDLRVKGDREKVEQILVNLMTNAIKFTDPKGKITLECERAPQAVRVHVRDTGRGIPEDKLLEIFEPFVQVARSAGSPGEGVGLGLAISRELSRAMGGELVAQSQIGVGSIFTLTLPSA
jgi:signal transduction histidine kinase/FixJ family two-component response regulator